jgi:DNA repair protein RadC
MNTNHKIQELPVEERPYEKCLNYGPSVLTDSELLAVIIRSGTKGRSSVELAREILEAAKSQEGLLGIHHLSMQELMDIKGIGEVKALQIKCIGELSKRIASLSARKLLDFQEPDTIAAYYMEQLRHEEQELMICMMLNSKNQLLGDEIISRGTVNSSVVSPRDLILKALSYRAVCIILVHNHPSGNPSPSNEDTLLTKRVKTACDLVDIPLLDHIIIGDQRYTSLRKEGILC